MVPDHPPIYDAIAESDAETHLAGPTPHECVLVGNALVNQPVEPTEPLPTAPPVNVDVPYLGQIGEAASGAVLECTMGNWEGTPDSYSYAWTMDGVPVGDDANQLPVTAGDVGSTAACVVTATNALGSTAAPPSNEVTIA